MQENRNKIIIIIKKTNPRGYKTKDKRMRTKETKKIILKFGLFLSKTRTKKY